MANPIPMFPSLWLFEMMAVLMPMTSPRMFNSGPPELPGLMAASVCSTSCDRCSATGEGPLGRADDADRDRVAEAERVADRPSPSRRSASGSSRRTSPRRSGAAGLSSSWMSALSLSWSRPTSLALYSSSVRLSPNATKILVAPSTTWLLVRMRPSLLITKPVPTASTTCSRGSHSRGPAGSRRTGRSGSAPPKNSVRSWAFCFDLVRMFTTKGEAALAMFLKVVASTGPLSGALLADGTASDLGLRARRQVEAGGDDHADGQRRHRDEHGVDQRDPAGRHSNPPTDSGPNRGFLQYTASNRTPATGSPV